MTARVLILDELSPAALDVFARRGLVPEVKTGLRDERLLEAVRDAEALVVRSATKITHAVIEAAPRLRVVGRAGIGVDNVDLETATERGVVVMNTPMGNATTTAELAIALVFALARHIPRADRLVRSGKWRAKDLVGTELAGKVLGVVGLGRIGRIVAERGRGIGMKVVGHDPYLAPSQGVSISGVELLGLDELLARSDFITVHVPLNDSTKNLISWKELARVKPGARLIQASRGGVVDEEAVLDALSTKRLAGAAFDVFVEEPPPKDHPLLAREDVIVTPHLGASSEEAQQRVALDIAEQISDFLLDGVARNAVNAPSLPVESLHEVAPYLLLAEKMGSFVAQRMGGPIRKLELSVAGELRRHGTEHVRLALLVGCLRHSLETGVNFVNAPHIARERGMLVLEDATAEAVYRQGEIRVRAIERAGGKTCSVSGTVFGREPLIVEVDEIRLDLPPRGHLLITRHQDRPGVLGQLGTLLGQHDVNIQRLELGPTEKGPAYGFLTLGKRPPPHVLEAIRALEAIEEAQLIQF
jgi:D-3-phosphoglycerate dehydrogenase